MKNLLFKLGLVMGGGIICTLFGCQQAELFDPNDTGAVKMKTVTVSVGIDGTDTKASLDSQTGAFTWQSGDLISVLATDGKFYDFILEGESGNKVAEFKGNIPTDKSVTTVAAYPRIVADGTDNTVLVGNTLNYVLPASWDYAKDVSNVPMVATFGEGAEHMSFKQVGGVMRFPVKNLPTEATFVVTMHDKTITGQFPVDITALGESCITAGTAASELVINYTSDVDGGYAEFNVPVPTGTYNNFKVTVKDAEGNELLTKNYSAENKVDRATLLNMKELVLPERPMVISEVWPFFVDARVVFGRYEGVEKYAFYIDDAAEPVIVDAENLGDRYAALVGGNFGHKTEHKVAVAKVVDGEPIADSKSEYVDFTTADIRQLTTNTGTKFVSVGWDEVAIANGPEYSDGLWSVVLPETDAAVPEAERRGYHVQLYAEDKETLIYDMIPFDGVVDYTGIYGATDWFGRVNSKSILVPSALTFGYLEPGKDYYFRVKTLDTPVTFDFSNGNFNSSDKPYVLSSERGGCAWSQLVKLATDEETAIEGNLIFHEGFDDMMLNYDPMNWAPAVVPQLVKSKGDKYKTVAKTAYPEFLGQSMSERKWSNMSLSKNVNINGLNYGFIDNIEKLPNGYIIDKLNQYAGSLQSWGISSSASDGSVYPAFGGVRLGKSAGTYPHVTLATTPIESDKLSADIGTKCIITVQISYSDRIYYPVAAGVEIGHHRGETVVSQQHYALNEREDWSEPGSDKYNYILYPKYFEVKHETYLRNGDHLSFARLMSDGYGWILLGDIKVEIIPGEYEVGGDDSADSDYDNGLGTEPDDTDYDAYDLGEFPITYWYTVEPAFYTKDGQYDYELTKQRYQEVKDAGINIVTYYGHSLDISMTEQKRILDICEELGLKYISRSICYGGNDLSTEMISATVSDIKNNLASSSAYIGDLLADEPAATKFESLGQYVDEFSSQMQNKDVYINLYPMIANVGKLGADSYEDYIAQYITNVHTKTVSYDYYPLLDNGNLSSTNYQNLDLVRSMTLKARKPFWVITQAGAVGTSRYPNEKEERWSVWSNIALGSKGVSYYCYWTPSGGSYDARPQMIDLDGKKTEMYDWVKKINADINTIGKKLIHCHADGAILTAAKYFPLYENNGQGRTHYGPIKQIKATDQQLLCGCFRDARISMSGDNYKGYKVLLTHELPGLNLSENFTAGVELDSSVTEITVTHCNTTKTVQISNTLNEQISENVSVSYDGAYFVVSMPEGEAVLLEF